MSRRPALARCLLLAALAGWTAACVPADAPTSATATKKEKTMSGLTSSRPPAPKVQPVIIGGVRYEPTTQTTTPGPERAPGMLGAYDAATGARLWTLKVYERPLDPRLERDVQEDHFATMIAAGDGKLHITTETGRKYEVDPAARSARALP
jgi:hypothetical protein